MVYKRRKTFAVITSIAVAVLCLYIWKVDRNHVPEGASFDSVSSAHEALRLRTAHGVFDLSDQSTLSHGVAGIPKSIIGLKPNVTDAGIVRKLVQFEEPIRSTHRQAVTSVGGTIEAYYPDNIFVVSIPLDKSERLASLPSVHTVVDRPVWLSVQPGLMDKAKAYIQHKTSEGKDATATLMVGTRDDQLMFRKQMSTAGFSVPSRRTDFVKVTGSFERLNDALAQLVVIPSVSSIHLGLPFQTSDSPEDVGTEVLGPLPISVLNNSSAGIIQDGEVDGTSIWDHGLTGEGQTIMVCDTGTDPDHLMFNDPLLPPTVTPPYDYSNFPADFERRKIVLYLNAHGESTEWDELRGHGTHVAGTMCGDFQDSLLLSDLFNVYTGDFIEGGLESIKHNGMAPKAKLVVSDIGKSDGSLDFASVEDIWGPGIHLDTYIVNNSWGRGIFPPFGLLSEYDPQVVLFDKFLYDFSNFLAVRAAGNDGEWGESRTIGFEAESKNELSVGALGTGAFDGTGLDKKASFSGEGPTKDGRIRPHIMAPGNQVISALGDGNTGALTKDLMTSPGTSMASPTVCGAVALIREYFTAGHYSETFIPSSAMLKAMAINSGTDLYLIVSKGDDGSEEAVQNESVGGHIPNNMQGWGRLTLKNVLAFSDDTRQLKVWYDGMYDDTNERDVAPLETGFSESLEIEVLDTSEELRFTLAWTDPAGAEFADPAIVNNLDLIITSPSGKRYCGNNFTEGQSAEGEFSDEVNTEECVYIREPELGIYKIEVKGIAVPGNEKADSDKQSFALVVTGGIPGSSISSGPDKSAGDNGCNIAKGQASVMTMLPLLLVGFILMIRRRKVC